MKLLSLSICLSFLSFSYALKPNVVRLIDFKGDLNQCTVGQQYTLEGNIYTDDGETDFTVGLAITQDVDTDGTLDLATASYYVTPTYIKYSDLLAGGAYGPFTNAVYNLPHGLSKGKHLAFAFVAPGKIETYSNGALGPGTVDNSRVSTSMGSAFPPPDASQAMIYKVEDC